MTSKANHFHLTFRNNSHLKGWFCYFNRVAFLLCLLQVHFDARCVIHLPCCTVVGLHVCDRDDGRGGWRTQKGESSADGLLVAWLLWPSGPLSSDCHSWGLRYRFLRRSHSSKLTPPTKHCLPRPTSHDAICPDRRKDRGLKPTYIFFHWFVLSFASLGSSINHFQPHLFTRCLYLLLCPASLSYLSWSFSSSYPPFSFQSTIHICLFNIPSPTLPPFAPAFTFSYLDRFHLGGNNPLTGSFIRMTSSNPFVAVGWINPAHSLALTEFIMEAQIQSA